MAASRVSYVAAVCPEYPLCCFFRFLKMDMIFICGDPTKVNSLSSLFGMDPGTREEQVRNLGSSDALQE
jgi:hypothetical protein